MEDQLGALDLALNAMVLWNSRPLPGPGGQTAFPACVQPEWRNVRWLVLSEGFL
ncbi:hypothetical protein [Streptomyces sp. NBC_01320]|uniref:hypothetical protein n=1 Tax=Streptomyces sp. NBC_01320 TaxID=2903824 RepID=UPI003FA3BE78